MGFEGKLSNISLFCLDVLFSRWPIVKDFLSLADKNVNKAANKRVIYILFSSEAFS
jgi:hypothetical protein